MVEISDKLLQALRGSGIYVFLDADDVPTYIGTAKHLGSRALSPGTQHRRNLALLGASSVVLVPCESDAEARFLENYLLARLLPRANVYRSN